MVLIAEAQQVKAKLQLKGRWRPDKMVRKKMPDGTGLLANVPQRRTSSRAVDDSVQDATLDQEYCDAIDKVSAVFGRQKRSNSTADEHRMYIRMLDGWLVRKGFGSYVEAIFDKHGLLVEVRPRRTATGEVKVLKAQMLIGYLLEMASGSKDTPKGGHAGDLLAQAGQEAVSACGVRSKMKRKKGTYGTGACADEPWSLQAYQKRVYAVRDCYAIWLKGTSHDNPGWDDAVVAVLGALARLVGKKPQHVPEALTSKQTAALMGAVDTNNPALMTIGAYVATQVVDGDRAETNLMLDWNEVVPHYDAAGKVDGLIKEIGQTKVDRTQVGERKALRCRSDCTGKLAVDADGMVDAARACPVELLLESKALIEKKLGLKAGVHIDEAVFADYRLRENPPRGATVVAEDEDSDLFKVQFKEEAICLITKAQEAEGERHRRGDELLVTSADGETLEAVSPNPKGLWFEVPGKPYIVRPWTNSSDVVRRLRLLATIAQRQARKAGSELPFGNAFKVADFKWRLASKTMRRTMVTAHVEAEVAPMTTMKQGGWSKMSTMMKYAQETDPFAAGGLNLTDVVLRGEKAVMRKGDTMAMLGTSELSKRLVQAEEEVHVLRQLLQANAIEVPPRAVMLAGGTQAMAEMEVSPAADVAYERAPYECEATAHALQLVNEALARAPAKVSRAKVSEQTMRAVGEKAPRAMMASGKTAAASAARSKAPMASIDSSEPRLERAPDRISEGTLTVQAVAVAEQEEKASKQRRNRLQPCGCQKSLTMAAAIEAAELAAETAPAELPAKELQTWLCSREVHVARGVAERLARKRLRCSQQELRSSIEAARVMVDVTVDQDADELGEALGLGVNVSDALVELQMLEEDAPMASGTMVGEEEPVPVFVKDGNGSHLMMLKLSASIAEVKVAVEAAGLMTVERQWLLFRGVTMSEEERTLAAYGVAKDDTLQLLPRRALVGGMEASSSSSVIAPPSSQDTVQDEWDDESGLEAAAEAGVPSAVVAAEKRKTAVGVVAAGARVSTAIELSDTEEEKQEEIKRGATPKASKGLVVSLNLVSDEDSMSEDEESEETMEKMRKVATAWQKAKEEKERRKAINAENMARFALASSAVQVQVHALYALLDAKQREALHGMLNDNYWVVVVSGPAGAGKSALLKILSLLKPSELALVAPTHGSRRADQEVVDEVLPRTSFKPEIEVHTTYTGLGVGMGEEWDAKAVIAGIKAGDKRKSKASENYQKSIIVCDEAAQTPYVQLDMAKDVGPAVNGGKRQRFILLMDGVQTPPVTEEELDPEREMIWESKLFEEAERKGELKSYKLETIYRTGNTDLLKLSKALRDENFDQAWPVVQKCMAEEADDTFVDVVHDNTEIYEVADAKFQGKPGLKVARARCEVGGPGQADLRQWSSTLQRKVRAKSKMLLEVKTFKGQRLHYQPIGGAGVRTGNVPGRGWYLTKGEPLDVIEYDEATRTLVVECPALKGANGKPAKAWIPEEAMWIDLDEYGHTKIWGPPYRYSDIVTVYSAQGSQAKKVHVRARLFKGQRNLLYTACTRAIEKLKISGIEMTDGGLDLRNKMELHPKSVLWQARLGAGSFSAARVAAAQLEVDKLKLKRQ